MKAVNLCDRVCCVALSIQSLRKTTPDNMKEHLDALERNFKDLLNAEEQARKDGLPVVFFGNDGKFDCVNPVPPK